MSGVNLKVTHCKVTATKQPMPTVTVAFEYNGVGKDHSREGIEFGFTPVQAASVVKLLTDALCLLAS